MNKKAHKYVVIFIVFFVLLRLALYFHGESEHQMSFIYDVMLDSTMLLLITLGPLYNHRLIYLYLGVVTIVFVSIIASEILGIINADGALGIINNLLGIIVVSIFTYEFYYRTPIKVLIKHNKTLKQTG